MRKVKFKKNFRHRMVRNKADGRANRRNHNSCETEVLVERNRKRVNRRNYALREIRYLQSTTKLLIPKAPFARLVRAIIVDIFPRLDIHRIQVSALEALQEAVEMYMVQFFEDALLICLHSKRVTLMQKDMILLRRLRGRDDIINR